MSLTIRPIKLIWQEAKKPVAKVIQKIKSPPAATGLVAFTLDKASKYLAYFSLEKGQEVKVTENLWFGNMPNYLGTYGLDSRPSFLTDIMSTNSFETISLSIILGGGSLLYGFSKHLTKSASTLLAAKTAIALGMAGLVGNITDRLTHSFVIDIVKSSLLPENLQVFFNLADLFILGAVPLWVLSFITLDHKQEQATTTATAKSSANKNSLKNKFNNFVSARKQRWQMMAGIIGLTLAAQNINSYAPLIIVTLMTFFSNPRKPVGRVAGNTGVISLGINCLSGYLVLKWGVALALGIEVYNKLATIITRKTLS